jgi:hypothetical protein
MDQVSDELGEDAIRGIEDITVLERSTWDSASFLSKVRFAMAGRLSNRIRQPLRMPPESEQQKDTKGLRKKR